jgi:hypothetical protein
MSDECRHARLAIGGEPGHLPAEVQQHLTTCSACTRFRDETMAMESRLRAALELPLHRFRKPAPVRRFALAASLLLAVLMAGGFWLLRPQPALAHEIIEHVIHEPGSWTHQDPVPPEQLAAVLAKAGVRYDARLPVVYASPCPFRGRIVPHLVVQTGRGPLTVMLLAHEKSDRHGTFEEGDYHGILLPAGSGSVAVIAPKGQEIDGYLTGVLDGIR